MDTIMKRFRRWIARREFTDLEAKWTAEGERLRSGWAESADRAFSEHLQRERAERELRELQDRVKRAQSWASYEAPDNREANVLLEWVRKEPAQGHRSGFWVDPFDRWGMYPKP